MKRLQYTLLALLASGGLHALPIGNPADPALLTQGVFTGCTESFWSVRVGYWGDFVFNRHMELKDRDLPVDDTEIFTNAGYAAFTLCDTAEVFATFGVTQLHIQANATIFDTSAPNGLIVIADSSPTFSWSVGGRWIPWECGCFTFGVEAQYFETDANLRRVIPGPSYAHQEATLNFKEWQLGVGVAYRMWSLVPYAGIKVSHAQCIHGGDGNFFHFRSQHDFGYALGVTLVDCERMALTIEARFPDEKAFHVNGQLRF